MKILIVGAGVAGLSLYHNLHNIHDVTIVERADTLRASGTGLMLNINVMDVLAKMALSEEIRRHSVNIGKFVVTNNQGTPLSTMQPGNTNRQRALTPHTIHRRKLHQILGNTVSAQDLRCGTFIESLIQDQHAVHVIFSDNTKHTFDLVVGADGIHSHTRTLLFGPQIPRYAGYTCWRCIIPTVEGDDAAREIWGRGIRIGLCQIGNGETYVFIVKNAPQKSERAETLKPALQNGEFDEILNYAGTLKKRLLACSHFVHDDISDLPLPNFGKDLVILIGDAAHATTPNMGQGAGMAIEDAYILAELIKSTPAPSDVLAALVQRRYARTKKIIDDSYALGKLAQTSNPAFAAIRNGIMKILPDRLSNHQMERFLLRY